MSYVDAGYAIALGVLALYTLSLLQRRRRLERAAGLRVPAALPTDGPARSAPGAPGPQPGAPAVAAAGGTVSGAVAGGTTGRGPGPGTAGR